MIMLMDEDPAAVVLIRLEASPPTQHTASLVGGQGDIVVVSVATPVDWNRDERVMCVAGDPGERRCFQAVYVAPSGRLHMLRRESPWYGFDARSSHRFEVTGPARVTFATGDRVHGRLKDLSTSGLAVSVESAPDGSHAAVDVMVCGYRSELPVEVVGRSERDGRLVLHCRFRALTPPQQAFLRAVVASLEVAVLQRAS